MIGMLRTPAWINQPLIIMDTDKLNRLMSKTKILLMHNPNLVFFSTLVLSLKTVWDESQPTAYVDGRVIGWNPTFYLGLDAEERIFVMAHEALHVVWKHLMPDRWQTKVMRVWQAACDFAINSTLIEYGFKMPKICLYDPRFKGMGADDIYDILIKEHYEPPPYMMEDLRKPSGDAATHQREVQDMLIRAVTVTKMAGKGTGSIPGDIEIMLQNLLDPKLPWTTILHRWLNARIRTGYDYSKPSKRYFPEFYLPKRESKGLKELVVFIDVSSSVEDFQFNAMVSELTGVFKRFKPNLTIITFNTGITGVHKVKSINELRRVQFKGRGGTDCECVFDWIETNKPDAVIVFTDGEFYWGRDKLSREIVWIINDNPHFEPRFGKAIHYETK